MTATRVTPEELAAHRAKQRAEWEDYARCGCGGVMECKATLQQTDGQGCGGEFLFQCPQCKNIEVRYRQS